MAFQVPRFYSHKFWNSPSEGKAAERFWRPLVPSLEGIIGGLQLSNWETLMLIRFALILGYHLRSDLVECLCKHVENGRDFAETFAAFWEAFGKKFPEDAVALKRVYADVRCRFVEKHSDAEVSAVKSLALWVLESGVPVLALWALSVRERETKGLDVEIGRLLKKADLIETSDSQSANSYRELAKKLAEKFPRDFVPQASRVGRPHTNPWRAYRTKVLFEDCTPVKRMGRLLKQDAASLFRLAQSFRAGVPVGTVAS